MENIVNIDFTELRRIVMALHNQGLALKKEGLTFSHGNIGNEHIELAKMVDQLVVFGEHRDKFYIVRVKPNERLSVENIDEVVISKEIVKETPTNPAG